MTEYYSGNWRDTSPRSIMKDTNLAKLEERLKRSGFKVVSNPRIHEEIGFNGHVEYIAVVDTSEKVKTPSR